MAMQAAVIESSRRILIAAVLALAWLLVLVPLPSIAQEAPLLQPGRIAVTGFSGVTIPGDPLPPGKSVEDLTFINTDGASLKLFDVSNVGGPPSGQVLDVGRPPVRDWMARELGQVFAIAFDNLEPANIYVGATSAFGLYLVSSEPPSGPGGPDRMTTGGPNAQWMEGQFGLGGGPGAIWKIDGGTGAVSLFATLPGNTASGIGGLAFDAAHGQLFTSDLDDGNVYRIDLSGNVLEVFDHGGAGRPALGLPAVADDGTVVDIASPAFDTEDPETWGLTPAGRRVHALSYQQGRLYYSVAEGPQVWSVGIGDDGAFAGDPRSEVDLPAGSKPYPVTGIAFDGQGGMILAQRGEQQSRYDYSVFATPRKSRVLRFRQESPDDPATPSIWLADPQEYSIGFPATYQNSAGGIAVGHDYEASGTIDPNACRGTLWTTGDALRESNTEADRLAEGGPADVHGLQGWPLSLVQPANTPPWTSYFIDYDNVTGDGDKAGQVGDVEAFVSCPGADPGGYYPQPEPSYPEPAPEPEPEYPPDYPVPEQPPYTGTETPPPDLSVEKHAGLVNCKVGNPCPFTIVITNEGPGPYGGPIVLSDTIIPGASLLGFAPPPWACVGGIGTFTCSHPVVTLEPGDFLVLHLTLKLLPTAEPKAENCAKIDWPLTTLVARNRVVEEALADLGFDPGAIDGVITPQTQLAIAAFRDAVGLPPGGFIDNALLVTLFGMWGVGDLVAANDQDCATVGIKDEPPPVVCPPGKFLLGGVCVDLPKFCLFGGKVLDPATGKCVCPPDKPFWNPFTKKCFKLPPPVFCFGGAVWNGFACVCPPDKPFWHPGLKKCFKLDIKLPCFGGKVWNPVTKSCVCPPDKPFWNPVTKICLGILIPPICPGDKVWNPVSKTCACPPDKPIWLPGPKKCIKLDIIFPCKADEKLIGGKCVKIIVDCAFGMLYDFGKKKCVCPADKPFFNPVKKQCQKLVLQPLPLICPGDQIYNAAQKKCVCPADKPFFNQAKQQCQKLVLQPQPLPKLCPANQVYSAAQKKCVCPPGKPFWSNAQKQCVAKPAVKVCGPGERLVGGKCVRIIVDCRGGMIYSKNQKKCVCPKSRPFFNKAKQQCQAALVRPSPCKKGFVLRNGRCRPIIVDPTPEFDDDEQEIDCPPGMVLTRRGCRPIRIEPRGCPRGMVEVRGRCVRIQIEQEPQYDPNQGQFRKPNYIP
ncbi:MAG: hypothetical protein M3N38_07120, partial [Pseudomonadota bacterium]|nr:hypothetical protein [Pseudomonadota bacterium]